MDPEQVQPCREWQGEGDDWSLIEKAGAASEQAEVTYCEAKQGLVEGVNGAEAQPEEELVLEFEDYDEDKEEAFNAKLCQFLQLPIKTRRASKDVDHRLSETKKPCLDKKSKREKRLLAEKAMRWQMKELLRTKFQHMSKQAVLNSLRPIASKGKKLKADVKGQQDEEEGDAKRGRKVKKVKQEMGKVEMQKKRNKKMWSKLPLEVKDKLSSLLEEMAHQKRTEKKGEELTADEEAAVKRQWKQKAKGRIYRHLKLRKREKKKKKASLQARKKARAVDKQKGKELMRLLKKNKNNGEGDKDKDKGDASTSKWSHLLGKEVVASREQVGQFLYGHIGIVKEVSDDDDVSVDFKQYLSLKRVNPNFLTLLPEKAKQQPHVKLKEDGFLKLSQCSRQMKKVLLMRLNLWGEEADLIEAVGTSEDILSQSIQIAFEWCKLSGFGVNGLHMVDPLLVYSFCNGDPEEGLNQPDLDEIMQNQFARMEQIKKAAAKAPLVLFPIYSNKGCQHWTLLVVEGSAVRF